MPLDTRIPMMYEGIQVDNPMNAMANAEKIKAMQMENALAEKQMNQQEDPRAAFINQSKAVVGHIKENLPILNENNADAFFKEVSGLGPAGAMASDSWFKDQSPAAQKLQRLNAGFNPPKQTNPDLDAANIMLKRAMAENLSKKADLDYQEEQARRKAAGSASGKMQGENIDAMSELDARLPALYEITDKLGALGQTATYTGAGKARDWLKREVGLDPGAGAVARAEYISTVDNEVLPLLRSTFGAAFTAAEGDRLRATLGNEDLSPPEKDAALRSFIDSKEREVRQLGMRYNREPQNIRPKQTGKMLSINQIQQAAAKNFGGDVNAAYQDALRRGYQVEGQ